jgi:3-dehydroquinate synthase
VQADNLILVGFMATGKSVVGRHCAELLGYTFHDTDAAIVDRAGMSIPEIFAREGEAGFRAREREVIAALAGAERQVIATGGGAIMDPENAAQLRRAGSIVRLLAQPETILSRVGDASCRPLLRDSTDLVARISFLLAEREPCYKQHAARSFPTDGISPKQIGENIVRWYRDREGSALRIDVNVESTSYPILIGEGLVTTGGAADQIARHASCARATIVTHPALRARYAQPIEAGLQRLGISVATVTIPPGERFKTLRIVSRLYDEFVNARLDRKSVVIAVGGGVLGDITGFAAATYLRGVRFVQVPTTLLAQVDSSVGGKTGVDLAAGKNLVGSFHQPSLVVIDPNTLDTLPAREVRSGLAEVIKYGIIYDHAFFGFISDRLPELLRRRRSPLLESIATSCRIKAEVVSQDETEQGIRAILNFGHTVGHALESITAYRRYKHGEAISIGMMSAALIGEELKVTPRRVTEAIRNTLQKAGLPTAFPADISNFQVLEMMQRDKKTESGKLRFILVREIGKVEVFSDVQPAAVERALDRHRDRASG